MTTPSDPSSSSAPRQLTVTSVRRGLHASPSRPVKAATPRPAEQATPRPATSGAQRSSPAHTAAMPDHLAWIAEDARVQKSLDEIQAAILPLYRAAVNPKRTAELQKRSHVAGMAYSADLAAAVQDGTTDPSVVASQVYAVTDPERGVATAAHWADTPVKVLAQLYRQALRTAENPDPDTPLAGLGSRAQLLTDMVTAKLPSGPMVLSAIVHAELATLNHCGPVGDGIVARVCTRLALQRGVDPKGLVLPEAVWAGDARGYKTALERYSTGEREAVIGWVLYHLAGVRGGIEEAIALREA